MPIGGAPTETFSTPLLCNCADRHVEEISSHRSCLLKLIFLHIQLHLVILCQKMMKYTFSVFQFFCCYGSKKPLATTLVCYNAITKCLNVLEIMAMITYLYAIHYIKSNAVCSYSNRCYGR